MITLHRLGHREAPFLLNPELIVTVEATPDTVITLTTAAKVVVAETVAEVSTAVHEWRTSVLSQALLDGRLTGARPQPARVAGAPGVAVGDIARRSEPAVVVGLRAGRLAPGRVGLPGTAIEGSGPLADHGNK